MILVQGGSKTSCLVDIFKRMNQFGQFLAHLNTVLS